MNILQLLPQLASGTLLTLELMILALVIGFCLALVMTVCVETKHWYWKAPIEAFVFVIRGTPLLVQIFIIYYGSGELLWLHHTFLWVLLKHPFGCATVALAINTSAYTTVLLRSAIHAVPAGEIEACQALGFSRLMMYRRIILPRAFRIVLPAYSNEVVMMLKSTSLASTITLMDLMGVTAYWIAMTYETIPLLILAGLIYLAINGLVIAGFRWLERRFAFDRIVRL